MASVPSDHVYVRHLSHPDADDRVRRSAEPRHDGPLGAPWWPSPMLSGQWVHEHAAEFDLMHLHFGFDAVPAPQLRTLADALAGEGRPLVFTVHDLRNPHHADRAAHDEALDVLVPAATEVLTLTRGAADVLRARYGRRVGVVPHPHVVPLEQLGPRPIVRRGAPFTFGVHLKSVRANMFTLDLVDALAEAVADLPDAVLRVDLHDVVDDPEHHTHVPRLLQRLEERADAGRIDLRVHPFFTDDQLWDYLASLDVSVLPYRFGTHSGWLEACTDLGTGVIAPLCGWYHEQQPILTYHADEWGFDRRSLREAVTSAYRDHPPEPADPLWRRRQRVALAEAHRSVYEQALAR